MRKLARSIIIHEGKLLVLKRNKYGNKFFVLPGGGIDKGETPQQAAEREVREETSIESNTVRAVYREEVPEFGETIYFLSEYVSGDPMLSPDSEEALATKEGDNVYEPIWIDTSDVATVRLLPTGVQAQLVHDLESGFDEGLLVIKGEKEKL